MTLPILVWTALDFFGGENRCISIVGFAVCSRAQNAGTSFCPLWPYVTETHTLSRGIAANDSDMQSFCQSFISPSVDAEPTARIFFRNYR